MAILFALLALFGWGVGDIFAALSSRKIGNLHTYIILQLIGMGYSIVLYPFFAGRFDLIYFSIAFFLAIIDNLGFLFFYKAFETGNVSLNGTIAVSYGLVIAALGFLFLRESLNSFSLAGIILISVGIVLSSLQLKEVLKRNLAGIFTDKGILYAILCMLFWGIYLAFLKIPVEKIGWYWSMVPISLMLPFLLIVGSIRKGIYNTLGKRINLKNAILHSILAFGGYTAYNLGISQGNVSVVGPIAGASAVLFLILSRIIFKDRLSKQQWSGIILTLVGIVFLSFS